MVARTRDALKCGATRKVLCLPRKGQRGLGVSVVAKAGATTSSSNNFAQSSSSGESRMHVAYLFPRVEFYFEVEDLELTEECKQLLELIRNTKAKKEDADSFFRKFGHVFVPHVQLGGRLYSVETTSSIAGASTEEKASALKAAASASVSGWGFQASVSASHETIKGEKTEKSQSSSNHSITWHADGGDTLLCNNPPAWCPTVHSYYNWRVMNFRICKWDSTNAEAKPYLGMVNNEQLIERPEGGGGNFSRRAKRHILNKSHSGEEHMKAGLEVLAMRNKLVWEGSTGLTPRFKYGIQYPLRLFGDSLVYGVRRTTQEEQYQKENVVYAGLDEEPNVLVEFRKIGDDKAFE
ncbi:hypothetical protein N7462_004954 [Penicillium macrosclerotiorum]|uniref:uncharacterized protein n=1 Tax=Penicillium macrosclerotiorum TaxID=303699 RepID=UPI0025488081|nr:uncharacterized protein N7462_004954 [Penicillium macrosclerotiorum]KAJ5690562.1 hypothetical protein N7462_004954 [Penicillium macrosclerotiorum]